MTYLAKGGTVSGPFDENQVAKMKESGDFYSYEWMWDGQSPDWSPVPRRLQSPPALPPEATKERTAPGVKKSGNTGTAIPSPQRATSGVDIITSQKVFPSVVFDNRQSVGGEISNAHTRGGKFVSSPNATSHFPKGATVNVDLLDEQKDKSVKIKATIATISRMDNRWVFELEWPGLPLL